MNRWCLLSASDWAKFSPSFSMSSIMANVSSNSALALRVFSPSGRHQWPPLQMPPPQSRVSATSEQPSSLGGAKARLSVESRYGELGGQEGWCLLLFPLILWTCLSKCCDWPPLCLCHGTSASPWSWITAEHRERLLCPLLLRKIL